MECNYHLATTPDSSPKRRAGRPRKHWSISPAESTETCPPGTHIRQGDSATSISAASTGLSRQDIPGVAGPASATFSSTDLELLLHFSTHTGPSIAGSQDPDHIIGHFWAHNVPQLGLSYDVVLHLAYALAAHHLAHLQLGRPGSSRDDLLRYRGLAECHQQAGLSRVISLLPCVNAENSPAVYMSSMMVFYCILANGPTGPGDLLVCSLDSDIDERACQQYVPLVQGVKTIRHAFLQDVLSSDLLKPLRWTEQGPRDLRPSFIEYGFPRLDWAVPLERLRGFITGRTSSENSREKSVYRDQRNLVLLQAFDVLRDTYESTFGQDEDPEAVVCPKSKFIFLWLYVMEDDFINLVREADPAALLLLAYYSLLFKTMKTAWYLDGWTEHLLLRIGSVMQRHGFADWMQWPMDMAGLS